MSKSKLINHYRSVINTYNRNIVGMTFAVKHLSDSQFTELALELLDSGYLLWHVQEKTKHGKETKVYMTKPDGHKFRLVHSDNSSTVKDITVVGVKDLFYHMYDSMYTGKIKSSHIPAIQILILKVIEFGRTEKIIGGNTITLELV